MLKIKYKTLKILFIAVILLTIPSSFTFAEGERFRVDGYLESIFNGDIPHHTRTIHGYTDEDAKKIFSRLKGIETPNKLKEEFLKVTNEIAQEEREREKFIQKEEDRPIINDDGSGEAYFRAAVNEVDNFNRKDKGLVGFFNKISYIVGLLVPLVIGVALLVFLWGITKYAFSSNEATRKDSMYLITYGIVALFVMVAVWGLVNLLEETFDLSGGDKSRIEEKTIDYKSLSPR